MQFDSRILSSGVAVKTAKQEAIDLIEQLPDEISLETILAELHFKLHVTKGLQDIEQGNVITHDEMKDWVSQWLVSSGR